jgi:DNA-binding XRE family transcriptional regulator
MDLSIPSGFVGCCPIIRRSGWSNTTSQSSSKSSFYRPTDMQKSPREKFAENLRRIRTKRGISKAELGRLAKMQRTEVGLLERGLREPRLGILIRLSVALEAPLGELFDGIEWIPKVPGAPKPGRFVAER